jgi:hypothetical protein
LKTIVEVSFEIGRREFGDKAPKNITCRIHRPVKFSLRARFRTPKTQSVDLIRLLKGI